MYKRVQILVHHWPINGIIGITINDVQFKMVCREDDGISNGYFYHNFNSLSKCEHLVFQSFVKKAHHIADIGANVGLYSLLAAKTNPASKIFAFEPGLGNYKRLTENLSVNKLSNVNTFQLAFGDKNATLTLFESAMNVISDVSSMRREQTEWFTKEVRQVDVKCKKLDSWCQSNNLYFDLMKIDVELFELEVLKGGISLLKRKPILFMENHNYEVKNYRSGYKLKINFNSEIEDILSARGYFFYGLFDKGIYRVDSLRHQPATYNFLILPCESIRRYYSLKDVPDLIEEVYTKDS